MKSFDHVSICGCWGMPPELRCLSPVSFVPTIRSCVINSMCMWYHVYVNISYYVYIDIYIYIMCVNSFLCIHTYTVQYTCINDMNMSIYLSTNGWLVLKVGSWLFRYIPKSQSLWNDWFLEQPLTLTRKFTMHLNLLVYTLHKTNMAPENRPSQKKLIFQPSIFGGKLAVSFREGRCVSTEVWFRDWH